MEPGGHIPGIDHPYVVRKHRVEPKHECLEGQARDRAETHGHGEGMHAGVGPRRGMQDHPLPIEEPHERLLQDSLHRALLGLGLPPTEIRAIKLEDETDIAFDRVHKPAHETCPSRRSRYHSRPRNARIIRRTEG